MFAQIRKRSVIISSACGYNLSPFRRRQVEAHFPIPQRRGLSVSEDFVNDMHSQVILLVCGGVCANSAGPSVLLRFDFPGFGGWSGFRKERPAQTQDQEHKFEGELGS